LGLAIVEAMMVGLPIVGLATTELVTVVRNGENGFIDTDVDVLVDCMKELLADADPRAPPRRGGPHHRARTLRHRPLRRRLAGRPDARRPLKDKNMKSISREPSILVTGGAGFVGSHLCDRLLAQGHSVLAVDDLSTGDPSHIAHLLSHPRFRTHSTTSRATCLRSALRAAHLQPRLPGEPGVLPAPSGADDAHQRARHLAPARVAEKSGARLLQASTSEVYGDPEVHPQTESYHGHVNPIGPRSCYDEGKRCAEAMAFAYRRERGLADPRRPLFNSYGPRLTPGDGRVVSNFIVQALRGDPLTVYGDGQQTRSFCYVDDTVDGLVRMMESAIEGPVNIGNPEEHTVLELAEIVLRLTGSRSRLVVGRCRPTTRSAGSPTSRSPAPSSAGSRASLSKTASSERRTISASCCRSARGRASTWRSRTSPDGSARPASASCRQLQVIRIDSIRPPKPSVSARPASRVFGWKPTERAESILLLVDDECRARAGDDALDVALELARAPLSSVCSSTGPISVSESPLKLRSS
jgi:UDP-glucuronate decarboxylase